MLKYSIKLSNSKNTIWHSPFWLSHQKQAHNLHNEPKNTKNIQPFQHEVKDRQLQAKRSLFIESPGASFGELASYCTKFGRIRNVYQSDAEKKSFFLVEFYNINVPNEIMRAVNHPGSHFIDGKIRTKSRFISFNPQNAAKQSFQSYLREKNLSDRNKILNAMREEKSVDDQIMKMYNVSKLSDLSTRLRFLTALQIEEAISGVFHDARVFPFGSSINGFGCMQSDLDMVLVSFGNRTTQCQFESIPLGKPVDVTRQTIRNNLFVLSSIVRHWLQGVDEVTPVLNARVPIIKYIHTFTQLDCDLSMGNFSGYQMSELFYTFCKLDDRVQPLTFYVRAWAKEFDLIQSYPALGLSNFMISCLVLFFLQQLPKPIIPPADSFILPEVNKTVQYITDTSKMNFKSENMYTLSELLMGFFEFYSSFDFNKDAISLNYGRVKKNTHKDSMFIHNTLEQDLNVSRNINDFERNQFVEKCKIARDLLSTGKVNAVDLLEYYNPTNKSDKIDKLVESMTNSNSKANRKLNGSSKLNIKTLMRPQ